MRDSDSLDLLAALLVGCVLMSFVGIGIIAGYFVVGASILAGCGIVAGAIWFFGFKPMREPVQELNVLVDLPAGTAVEVAPLLLNSTDSAIFSFLLEKCTRNLDQGRILFQYARHGEIYDPQQNVF